MNLESIMTKDVVVMRSEDSFYDVSNAMKQYDIGFIPVSSENKIIGVITDRDIVVRAISNNVDLDSKIENYITNNVISVEVGKSLDEVIDIMGRQKIKRVIVTDNGKVVGVVSLSDIINCDVEDNLINSLKEIWAINQNIDTYETEIDEFYL